MRVTRRLSSLVLGCALAAAMLVGVDRAYGQTSPGSGSDTGLSSILQGLSPDQRQSIEQQIGTTGLGGAPGGQGTRVLPETEEQQSLMLQQQRQTLLDQEKQRAEMQRLSPFLEANDWIVITVDSNPLPAANRPPPSLTQQPGIPGTEHRPAAEPFSAIWPRRSAELRAPRPPPSSAPGAGSGAQDAAAAALGAEPAAVRDRRRLCDPAAACVGQPNCDTVAVPAAAAHRGRAEAAEGADRPDPRRRTPISCRATAC